MEFRFEPSLVSLSEMSLEDEILSGSGSSSYPCHLGVGYALPLEAAPLLSGRGTDSSCEGGGEGWGRLCFATKRSSPSHAHHAALHVCLILFNLHMNFLRAMGGQRCKRQLSCA
jgi:hypothetical protein